MSDSGSFSSFSWTLLPNSFLTRAFRCYSHRPVTATLFIVRCSTYLPRSLTFIAVRAFYRHTAAYRCCGSRCRCICYCRSVTLFLRVHCDVLRSHTVTTLRRSTGSLPLLILCPTLYTHYRSRSRHHNAYRQHGYVRCCLLPRPVCHHLVDAAWLTPTRSVHYLPAVHSGYLRSDCITRGLRVGVRSPVRLRFATYCVCSRLPCGCAPGAAVLHSFIQSILCYRYFLTDIPYRSSPRTHCTTFATYLACRSCRPHARYRAFAAA